jgi:hypothetical protein
MRRYALALAALAQTTVAIADDRPIPVPDGSGGYTVTFEARHFVETSSGSLEDDAFSIPREPAYRPCVLATLPAPVLHGDGYADVSFELDAGWVGFLNLQRGEESDLLTSFVTVRRGSDARSTRDWLHTGLLDKHVDYIAEDGSSHVFASTNGYTDDYASVGIPVKRGDTVTVKICEVRPAVWLKVRSITLHTYPSAG